MIVSLEWLKDYTDVHVSPEEFCDRMIMSGSNLETMELVGEDIQNVVVGRIARITPHPDADKLVVCQIDIGQDAPIQIVTGAPNVFEGAYVPVALDGSHIPGPLHGQPKQEGGTLITKGSLRGVESDGMLCSFGELGFEDKVVPINQREGIWILEKEYPLGSDFAETMELKDAIIDFEITPNRPDCLSMIGMAREAALSADLLQAGGRPRERLYPGRSQVPALQKIRGPRGQGRQGGGFPMVAAEKTDSRRHETDQ